jgi:peptidoglycan hydrolase CwlO-like protein
MKAKLTLLGLVLSIIGTVILQILNSGAEHIEVVDTAQHLEADNTMLEEKNEQLEKHNTSLKKKVHKLSKQVSELKNQTATQEKPKKKLKNEKTVTTSNISSEQQFEFKPINLPDSEDN